MIDQHEVVVVDHCQFRWNERVGHGPGPEADVRAAFAAGRVSTEPPDWWLGAPAYGGRLFALTEDGLIAYVVHLHRERENAWAVTTVGVKGWTRAPQPPLPPSPEHRLLADIAKLKPSQADNCLHLPPARGHAARTERARGVWTVTCSCGGLRIRGAEADRHALESAWGRHRNGLDK